jgi:hypothetical protein
VRGHRRPRLYRGYDDSALNIIVLQISRGFGGSAPEG